LQPHLFLLCSAFGRPQSSFDCAALDSTEYFLDNALLGPGAAEGNARLSTLNDS
jgi:hypothetical protein